MTEKQKAIIVDLDGTLADCEARRKAWMTGDPNWKRFYADIPTDKVMRWCLELILAMRARGYAIVIMTGREWTDQISLDTVCWLNANLVPYDAIYYRAAKDYRKDAEVKAELFEQACVQFEFLFAVDDRKSVVEMWREKGLTCLQCDDGEF